MPSLGWSAGPNTAAPLHSFNHCFEASAAHYGLDPQILRAIAMTETGMKSHLVGPKNNNGTYDIGLMQINSAWLKTLGRYGITEQGLFNACTNIQVGSWILANNVSRHGHTWKSVGAYNAATPSKQLIYVEKVKRNYARVLQSNAPKTPKLEVSQAGAEIVVHSEF